MANITRSEVQKVIREFLDEYGCGSYIEGGVSADGPKLPEGTKPDLYFVQTDDEGNTNTGIVMIVDLGKQNNKSVQDKLRTVVNAWVDDEFDLLMISLPATEGEKAVEQFENIGIYADYWLLYEREEDGELALTILYDEMDEEEEPITEEEIIVEEVLTVPEKPKSTVKKTKPTEPKPKPEAKEKPKPKPKAEAAEKPKPKPKPKSKRK